MPISGRVATTTQSGFGNRKKAQIGALKGALTGAAMGWIRKLTQKPSKPSTTKGTLMPKINPFRKVFPPYAKGTRI